MVTYTCSLTANLSVLYVLVSGKHSVFSLNDHKGSVIIEIGLCG